MLLMKRLSPVLAVLLTLSPSAAPAQQATQPRDPAAGIRFLDLADQASRQLVVDREQGQYLGHPTTVLLEDGKTIVTVYPKGHGKGPIVLKRSEDGGLTWSERMPTPENWTTSQETPTIHRVIDAAGKKRLIVFSGMTPIRLSVSEDDGRTWSPLKKIGDFGGVVAMASVERLKDGRYMALYHGDGTNSREGGKKPTAFRVYKTLSADGGLTWGEPIVIAEDPKLHFCEPGLIRSPDGRQIAVFLRENSRAKNSHLITSDDEGETWTKPRELPLALTGDRHTGKYAPDGRLFVSFRDTAKGSPTWGDWVAWVGTYDDVVHGRDGQYKVRLMDNRHQADCAYPGVEVLPDGTLVATTYGHWTEGEKPYIVSVRLRLAELDAMARSNP
ncbi:sialidase family protein [Paludisphaera mucosa]|uniref:Sialidase family protein n=1 Tax=Paludisphaera mucosa TaxID=3030827 RepID=A0ABT6F977_9BACT|nr:sialidase family protein [Paludisphaera mucosa]MDG3003940.1 sialidase family protein [Paludisphaera mucosa]